MATGITQLADNDFGDNLGDGVAGPIGLLIIVLLVIATVFLIRNMNARLRRLPERFPAPPGTAARGIVAGGDPDDRPADATAEPGDGTGEAAPAEGVTSPEGSTT